jgi:hypothetical protein
MSSPMVNVARICQPERREGSAFRNGSAKFMHLRKP